MTSSGDPSSSQNPGNVSSTIVQADKIVAQPAPLLPGPTDPQPTIGTVFTPEQLIAAREILGGAGNTQNLPDEIISAYLWVRWREGEGVLSIPRVNYDAIKAHGFVSADGSNPTEASPLQFWRWKVVPSG